MMRIRKWLFAIPFIFIYILGLPTLITGRWNWFLVNIWDSAFVLLWIVTWIVGIYFYRPSQHQRLPGLTRLAFSMSTLVVPLLAIYDRVRSIAAYRSSLWAMIGLVLFLAGAAIGLSAWRSLNRWYAPNPTILPGQRLITSGPYRLVRHPMYTALLLALPSLPLLLRSLWGLGLSLLLILPGLWLRIREEEILLLDEFSDAYQEYIARTWRLVPFIH